MKNFFTSLFLGIVLAGVSFAQTSTRAKNTGKEEIKVAVIEFSPGNNTPVMTTEAKRQIQASMAFALHDSRKFKVVDVRNTRKASQSNLTAINSGSSTAAAVKIGKQLGVNYVLTGIVVEYTPKGADGFGRVVLKTRFIDVATGKVKHESETAQISTSAMRTENPSELQSKAIKPATLKLAETLVGLRL